ncbi:MAG: D-alanine--D-alanine ligase [Planctomycetota bacterium]|nr:MAG: D-alanine--D-alanine ligase [Planctomycetota bacterium]
MSGRAPLRLAVLFGGRSAEHDVSLASARAVLQHLDPARYDLHLAGITRSGGWLGAEASLALLNGQPVLEPGGPPSLPPGTECVFPVLHGPCGEDGTVQGWLELLGVPSVGADTTGSALAMDKSLTKHVLRSSGLPVLPWTDVEAGDFRLDPAGVCARVVEQRGLPCFVKPARLGSSIGISKVESGDAVGPALEEAFRHGRYALVEPYYDARELEIAVLDGDPPLASPVGEIRPRTWYSYEEKYRNSDAQLLAPAPDLHPRMVERFQELALAVFGVLRLRGMARVDFFLGRHTGRLVISEVNTIPGFTAISMYPKLMALAGVPFGALCDRLIEQATSSREAPQRPAARAAR